MSQQELTNGDISLPVKRVEGETLEERMTENAYNNILPARYLNKNTDGEVVEDQEQIFERVGRNVALSEVVYGAENLDTEVTVTPDQIKKNQSARGHLAAEVFGYRGDEFTDIDDFPRDLDEAKEYLVEDEVTLTEDNVSKFSYETVVPEIENDELRETVEYWADQFIEAMETLSVMPNSPTIMNAGDELQQLSACFVTSPRDDMEDIHDTAKEAAMIFQSGGGVGYGFWGLRPQGDAVGSTGGVSSGPLTFMQTFDQVCDTVAQGGVRRGAQMGVMRVSHPDVLEFIKAKSKAVSLAHTLRLNDPDDFTHTTFSEALEEARELIDDQGRVPEHLRNAVEGNLSNFNISVGVTDGFMEALKNDEEYTFTNPRTGEPHIATRETVQLYERHGYGEYVEVGEELSVPAEELWEDMIEGAHENGEPGMVFLERMNKDHSFPIDTDESPQGIDVDSHRIHSTNPCVAEGTLVNTPEGYVPVEDVDEGDDISTVFGVESVDEVEVHTDYEVYEVEFSNGTELEVTGQHRFHVLDGKSVEEVPLTELSRGDYVRLHPGSLHEEGTDEQYREQLMRGVMIGDGCYTEAKLDINNQAYIASSIEDDLYNDRVKTLFGPERFNQNDVSSNGEGTKLVLSNGRKLVNELDLTPAKSPEKDFDVTDINTEKEAIGILDGLLPTDGNVNLWSTQPSVRWTTASDELAESIREVLNLVGVNATISENTDPQRGGKIDGRKVSPNNPKYTVTISGDSAGRYAEMSEVGTLHQEKQEKLDSLRRDFVTTGDLWKAEIRSIEEVNERKTVYDLYCSESDTWITEGFVQQGCGEQPLMENEACNLGHINLSTLVNQDAPDWRNWIMTYRNVDDPMNPTEISETDLEKFVDNFLDEAIDMDVLDHRIEVAYRLLEDVVTMSDFPTEDIQKTVSQYRKVGVGIMGLAQMYIQMGVRYGSPVGNEVARQLMRYINQESKKHSHEMAQERGSFNDWEESKYADPTEYREWFERQTGLDADEWADGFEMRNHNTTTIAPTGTTSMLGNTTGGCEPIYNVAYYKNVTDDVQGDEMLVEFDDYFLRVLEENNIDVDEVKEEAQKQMAQNEHEDFDGVDGLSTVPDEVGELFVTTGDLTALEHADVQTALQEGVDSSISKTVNAPNDATVEDTREAFERVYDNGGKGVTYYRDGTRSKQVLTTREENTEFTELNDEEIIEAVVEQFGSLKEFVENETVEEQIEEEVGEILRTNDEKPRVSVRERPDVLSGVTQRVTTGYGEMYVNINVDENGEPFELFAQIGNSGGFTASFTESLAKVVSTSLRAGVDPQEMIDMLEGIRSPKVAWDNEEQIQSIPDAIGTALRRYVDGEIETGNATLNNRENGRPTEQKQSEPREVEPRTNGHADPEEETDATDELIDDGEVPVCPECGSMDLYYSEGCKTCQECGWSECS